MVLLVAASSTVELPLALPKSIVPVVESKEAFVAVKLKSVPADDGPFIVTVPVAASDIFALPWAFAVMFATFVENGLLDELPSMFPLEEVRFKFVALTVPVILLLFRSL